MNNDFIYDIETFPNVFTLSVEHACAPLRWCFEISDFRNESREILSFLKSLKSMGARMVGFNNLGFDYPVLHTLILTGRCEPSILYKKAMMIIQSQDDDNRWVHQVYKDDRFIEQIDLYKIHHFDNRAKATSLKVLEFNMRADSIEDLPFPVGKNLTRDEIVVLKKYNMHDVKMTKLFYHQTLKMIKFREELTRNYQRDFMNHNDTKIGKDYFIMKLQEAGVECYEYGSKGRTPRQTRRSSIQLFHAILPSISFQQPEFNRMVEWLRGQTIVETKAVYKDLSVTIKGFKFVFGLGGIHGSVDSRIVESDNRYVLIDLDVSSYYPNLAIVNNFYPQHLGEMFCKIYKWLYEERRKYKKKSTESEMLKLALNGVYGDSNSVFSVFYDPLFTMRITLNGQLLLCQLAERVMQFSELIQINTDGMTVRILRDDLVKLQIVCQTWEGETGLSLESAAYSKMFIRDVNNYLAVYDNGDIKRKGAYEYDLDWNQNHSALVIPMVAEKVLVEGVSIRETVENWSERMDFMMRVKVPRSSRLVIQYPSQWGDTDFPLQNITRYYVAVDGGNLVKIMPPLKGNTEDRRFNIESGWGVQVCNDIKDAGNLPIDYEYYIQEVEKLCIGLK